MGRKARADSVVERQAERDLMGVRTGRMTTAAPHMEEVERALADKAISIFARDLKMHDKIYEGRRGGKVRFKEVKKIRLTRKNQKVIVNDERVYDYYCGKVLVLR